MSARPLSHWLLLASLVVLWGSSFGLIKVAIVSFTPATLVSLRVLIAALLLGAAATLLRQRWPKNLRFWLFCVVLAVTGNCLPFYLITLSQQRIDSGMSGILMAIMPLSTLVLAHFFVAGERLNRAKLLGCLLGFIGIVVLIGPAALTQLGGTGGGEFWYQLAALGAALSYAANAVLTRHRPPADALVTTAALMLTACVIMLPFGSADLPAQLLAADLVPLLAAAILGAICTGLATVLFLQLIALAGPSFMSFINYLIPLWALLIGALFLGEQPRWSALAALALILIGIAVSEIYGRRPASH